MDKVTVTGLGGLNKKIGTGFLVDLMLLGNLFSMLIGLADLFDVKIGFIRPTIVLSVAQDGGVVTK